MWVNLEKLALTFIIFVAVCACLTAFYKLVEPPNYYVKYDCREVDGPNFPIEVRSKCEDLMAKIKR